MEALEWLMRGIVIDRKQPGFNEFLRVTNKVARTRGGEYNAFLKKEVLWAAVFYRFIMC